MYVYVCISYNTGKSALPVCQQHLSFWTLYFSTHKVSYNYNTPHYAQSLH